MTYVELIAAILGAVSVYFYIIRNHWSWPVGLAQVILFVAVFAQAKLYADMILHLVYTVLQLYGWWQWSKSRLPQVQTCASELNDSPQQLAIQVRRLSPLGNVIACSVGLLMTLVYTYLLLKFTDASLPLADCFVSSISIVAQCLLAWRYLENWLYWIVVDVAAIALFAYKQLWFTTGLYGLFLVMAVIGYRAWRHTWIESSDESNATGLAVNQ
ncbi:MAG: nicotinamide riboside transporter PnuC [Pirellulales bacterium]